MINKKCLSKIYLFLIGILTIKSLYGSQWNPILSVPTRDNFYIFNLAKKSIITFGSELKYYKKIIFINVKDYAFYCETDEGKIILDDCIIELNGDSVFEKGRIEIQGKVEITGKGSFSYSSKNPIFMHHLAELSIDDNILFQYCKP